MINTIQSSLINPIKYANVIGQISDTDVIQIANKLVKDVHLEKTKPYFIDGYFAIDNVYITVLINFLKNSENENISHNLFKKLKAVITKNQIMTKNNVYNPAVIINLTWLEYKTLIYIDELKGMLTFITNSTFELEQNDLYRLYVKSVKCFIPTNPNLVVDRLYSEKWLSDKEVNKAISILNDFIDEISYEHLSVKYIVNYAHLLVGDI